MGSCVFWARVGGMIAPQILLSVSFSLIFYMLCVCLLFSQYIDSELLINPSSANVVYTRHDVNVACSGCSATYGQNH